jgi:hypothetical protein
MSQELTTTTAGPLALTVAEEEINELKEAVAMNVGTGGMSEFDLPRITVTPGTALWQVPTAKGSAPAERIEGVIVFMRDTRAYYKSKDSGNVPPDCSSTDCITGIGTPGGNCLKCPLAQFESAVTPDGQTGKGQACKQVKQLFMLRGESLLPEVVSIPPTSLKAARKFFNWMVGQRIPHAKALVAITLENAKNAQGKPYGKAVFDLVRSLNPDEVKRTMMFRDMCETFVGKVPVDLPAEMQAE